MQTIYKLFLCFNSSVVRLKDPIDKLSLAKMESFNSSVVRLKDPGEFGYDSIDESFNSSVVRLKVLYS